MKEFEIRDQICEFLAKRGIFHWKDRSLVTKPGRGTSSSAKGVPDILGILPDGTFLGIEVKTKDGRIRPEQDRFIKKATDLGGLCFVARSLDDVIKRFP